MSKSAGLLIVPCGIETGYAATSVALSPRLLIVPCGIETGIDGSLDIETLDF